MPFLILVVNDEPVLSDVLSSFLTNEGYRVRTACDGQAALDDLVLHRPDVIVSYIKMPRMHGLTLVERVRAEGNDVPFILISTWTRPVMAGVRFVRKPFDLDHLNAAVERSLTEG